MGIGAVAEPPTGTLLAEYDNHNGPRENPQIHQQAATSNVSDVIENPFIPGHRGVAVDLCEAGDSRPDAEAPAPEEPNPLNSKSHRVAGGVSRTPST